MNPLVSVITPVYNREHLVAGTIESVLAQTYPSVELILINDGSSDGSLSVLREYEQRFPEKVRVVDQSNQGQVAARNNGIKVAKGELVAFLDSDDLWLPNKLELQVPLFEQDVGLVYGGVELINEEGKVIGEDQVDPTIQGWIYPQLLVKNRMTGGSVVVLREAFNKVGRFDPKFKAAENWDLWLRICKEYKARLVDRPVVRYRLHDNNMSKDMTLMHEAKLQIMSKHCNKYSSDKLIAHYSRLAEVDLLYKKGVYFFSQEEFGQAIKKFYKVVVVSPFYEDAIVRLLRSLLGRSGNRILRKLKKIESR